jgi:hypothetical protein
LARVAGAVTGLAAAFGAGLGAAALTGLGALAAAGFAFSAVTALDFAAGLGLEAAFAGFGDVELDADGDLAMERPTPRLEWTRHGASCVLSIRHHTGV